MSDLNEFETMNKVYEEVLREHLGEEPLPARTTFQAGRVPRDARSVFIVCVVIIVVIDVTVVIVDVVQIMEIKMLLLMFLCYCCCHF
jgi:enamine deaminase RidA (YjgF/YER057c/UK114 family)